jgi:guanylate kinase
MSQIVFIFGASCSGKSNLSQALHQHFRKDWQCIDRDDLIEQSECSEANANATLDAKIQSIGKCVIIDAQIPWRKKRSGEFYFLVFPPLKILLERDQKRTINLKRNEQRAAGAKAYVEETHEILEKMAKEDFDLIFDSSQISVKEEIDRIKRKIIPGHFPFPLVALLFCIAACALFIIRQKKSS